MGKKTYCGETWDSVLFSFAHSKTNPRDKLARYAETVDYMLDRTSHIIEYEGFDDTVNTSRLELYRQMFGFAGVGRIPETDRIGKEVRIKPTSYVFTGSLSGELDENYFPTEYIVNVPYFSFSHNYKIGKDIVLFRSDTALRGFLPLIQKYAALITESELSLFVQSINARALTFATAADSRDAESARKVFSDLEDGKTGVAISKSFIDGIKAGPFGSQSVNAISQQIELTQYLKSSLFAEVGLPMNGNMKREALNAAEVGANDLSLLPLIDDYIYWTEQGVKEYNEMFDASVKWRLSGAWRDVVQDLDDKIESAAEEVARMGEAEEQTERETGADEPAEDEQPEEVKDNA